MLSEKLMHIKNNIYNDFLKNDFEIIDGMKKTTHSYIDENNNIIYNIHHLEDDVWSHVNLMYEELDNLIKIINNNYDITEKDITILSFSVLLHDIGKVKTKNIKVKKNGETKVVFYSHAEQGSFKAFDIINRYKNKYELDNDDIIKILYCVNNHMNFFVDISGSLITDENFVYKFGNNNILKMTYKYLFMLNILDKYGKITKDNDVNKYDDKFFNDFYKISHFEKYYENKNNKKFDNNIIMLSGIPSSGKSTYIKQMNLKDYVIASTDDIIMELGKSDNYEENFKNVQFDKVNNIFNNMLKKAYNNKQNVIIDQTNLSRRVRNKKLKLFNGYEKRIITFLAGSEIIERNNNNRRIKENKYIEKDVINNMISNFQYSVCDEANIIDIILCS